jgi:hypothetical protein
MVLGSNGLRDIKTDELKRMLLLLHRGELRCPLDAGGLTAAGLFPLIDRVGLLHGLDAAAVRAVVVAVLAERLARS